MHIVIALQTIVSSKVNLPSGAAVFTVGQISGGNRLNIIPKQSTLSGTIRTFPDDTRKLPTEAVERVQADRPGAARRPRRRAESLAAVHDRRKYMKTGVKALAEVALGYLAGNA